MMELWMELAQACWRRWWLRPLSVLLWAGFGLVMLACAALLLTIVAGLVAGIVVGVLGSHPSAWGWTAIAAVPVGLLGASAAAVSMSDTMRGLGLATLAVAAVGLVVPAGKAIVDASKSHGFCASHRCIDSFDDGRGYIVRCADGMWSHSGGLPGACSWHGGE